MRKNTYSIENIERQSWGEIDRRGLLKERKATFPLTTAQVESLGKKAQRASQKREDILRRGIDFAVGRALDSTKETREEVIRLKENAPSPSEEDELTIMLGPKRVMWFWEVFEKVRSSQNETENIKLQDLLRFAGHLAAEEVGYDEVGDEKLSEVDEENSDYRYMTKVPGKERGGLPIRIEVTEEGKKKMDVKAKKTGWATARLARQGIREMLNWAEENPSEALTYIFEEREYYQGPPKPGGEQYGYVLYVGITLKSKIKRMTSLLSRRRVLTQKRLLQAAGRWTIEETEAGLESLGVNVV